MTNRSLAEDWLDSQRNTEYLTEERIPEKIKDDVLEILNNPAYYVKIIGRIKRYKKL